MLADSEELPTTSQPSPEAFLQYFREAKEAGDDVICILPQANSAVLAKVLWWLRILWSTNGYTL